MDMNLIFTKNMMEKKRSSYIQFVLLCSALNEFSLNKDTRTTDKLKSVIQLSQLSDGGIPLPSGRWGNALAVALEMQLYPGALFMIENAEDLEIDLDSVSSELGGGNVWNAQQTFELSQLGFETTKIEKDNNSDLYKRLPSWVIQAKNINIDAALEIAKLLQEKKVNCR